MLEAGGIADGKGLAAAMMLGAQGVVVGTAFLAAHESFAHDYLKNMIVVARSNETLHTEAFHIDWPEGAPVWVLPNSVARSERGDPFSGANGDRRGRGPPDLSLQQGLALTLDDPRLRGHGALCQSGS